MASSILLIQQDNLVDIMSYCIAEGNLTSRLVCKNMCEATDLAIGRLWERLKAQPPEGAFNLHLSLKMSDIQKENKGKSPLQLFRILNLQLFGDLNWRFAGDHWIRPSSRTVPISGSQFVDIQRLLLDRSLETIWMEIIEDDRNQGLPVLTSAAAVRNYLNNPANIPQLNTITELHLVDSDLQVFPPEIRKLTQLRIIDIYNHELAIPDLSALTELLRLELSANQLTAIPDLSASTELRRLDLSKNLLTAIPDLSALTKLKSLDLSHNKLETIPGLSALIKLKSLALSNNKLETIPGLSALTQLQWLDLSNNKLKTIPDLSAFTELRGLDLRGNQLTTIPGLSALKQQLEEFYYDGNPLK